MAVTNEQAGALLAEVDDVLRTGGDRDQTTGRVMRLIADRLPHYNWVGVYVVDGGMLHLGPYVGEPTEHTLIPIGRGVCGTAVADGQNQVSTTCARWTIIWRAAWKPAPRSWFSCAIR
jgi:GAF domain-containing protein